MLGWTAINGNLDIAPIMFYFAAIFWTLGYDTIYGFQDIKDDEIIGLKSTSIKFKENSKLFLLICYLLFILSLFIVGVYMNFNYVFYFFMIFPFYHLIFYQMSSFNPKNSNNCLKIFRSNNFLGFLIFLNLLIGKIIS